MITASWLAVSQPLQASADGNPEGERAQKLLRSAIEYYRVQGDAALPAFSRQGAFIDGEHYVFVIDTRGTMLASGGTSAELIGRDVSKTLEPELRKAFAEALAFPEGKVGTAEYRWLNAKDGRIERKQVYYQRVGDRVLAVGQYIPRASAQQAKELLDKAATAIAQDAQGAISSINDLSPSFRQDDLYVFVINLDNRRYVAHGYNLRLLGVDFATIKDPDGKAVGAPILAQVKQENSGGYDYRWRNPVTGKVEDKHALFRKVGPYLVAVGYYLKPR